MLLRSPRTVFPMPATGNKNMADIPSCHLGKTLNDRVLFCNRSHKNYKFSNIIFL
jgi:hypothetical protein